MRIIKVLIAAALLWSLYWYAAGFGLRSGIEGWFSERSGQGWQADFSEISTSGYPGTHATLLTHPTLADPETGAAWRADWLIVESPAIWPGHQTLRFPQTPQRLSYLDQTIVLTAQDLIAKLFLAPGQALELEDLALDATDWLINDDDGPVLAGETLLLAMTKRDGVARYDFQVDATALAPGLSLRHLATTDTALPDSFETLRLDMSVDFDRSWDRRALETQRPQPRRIDLKLADAHWGPLRLRAAGALTVDDQGVPTGTLTIKANNWRDMLQMAQAARALSPQAAQGAERVFGMLAGLGGDPDAIDVKLGFRDGLTMLGPLPVGPAPRLILR